MVPADAPGLQARRDAPSPLSEEDEHLTSSFQQELRSHLLAVQHKLDLLASKMDCGQDPPLGLCLKGSCGPFDPTAPPPNGTRLHPMGLPGAFTAGLRSHSPSGGHRLDFPMPNAPMDLGNEGASSGWGRSSASKTSEQAEDDLLEAGKEVLERRTSALQPTAGVEACEAQEPAVNRRRSIFSGDGLRLEGMRTTMRNITQDLRSSVGNRIGLDKLMRTASDSMMEQKTWLAQRRLWHFVHGTGFQVITCLMIVANVILIGVMADDQLKAAVDKTKESPAWEYLDLAFCIFFALELMLRVVSDRIVFVLGSEWRWNLFDTVLVVLSVADAILNRITSLTLSNVTVARVLRFVRLIRVVRIVRAVRAFHNLRIVVFAIFESMLSLVWCLLVVGGLIYIFAILFLYGVTEHFSTAESAGADPKLKDDLLHYYGSVPTSIGTLFMTISGGVDWQDVMLPLKAVHWTYQPLFIFYVFLMVIGVLNVVMGAFVAATAEIANRDKDALVKAEIQQLQVYTQRIKSFFQDADRDKSGMLSWGEFEEHLKVPTVSAYFRTLELDVSQAHALFRLLDNDASGEVGLDEFLAGCMRLKGQAKSLEVNMLLYENRRLFNKMADFMEAVAEQVAPETLEAASRKARSRRGSRQKPTEPPPPPDVPTLFGADGEGCSVEIEGLRRASHLS